MARRRFRSEVREKQDDRVKRVTDQHDPKQSNDIRWFRQTEPHEQVFALDQKIARLTSTRAALDIYHAFLYEDAELAALISGVDVAQGEFTPQTMVSNVVKRQVDTYVSRQDKNQPVPMALPNDGTYEQGQRAEELTKLFAGVFDAIRYQEMLSMRRRDRAIFGSGFAHNYRIGKKLFHERVFPFQMRADPREAMYGKPRTLILRRWIDRLVLAEQFPESREEILNDEYNPPHEVYDFAKDDTADLVFVIEIWHLPNGEPTEDDAKDGAHCTCISTKTLQNRVYKRDYFPFSQTHFSKPLAGWRGEGMAAQLRGLQFEINSIGLRLQEQAWMTGTYVWTPTDVGLEVDHLDNGTLTHIQSDVPPQFVTPAPWHPQFFDYYMFLRGRAAAEETRQSEQSSRGELPAGLESGKAIRSWNQLDDQAFLSHGKEDERDAIDTAWQHFDLCEEIHEEEQLAKKTTKKKDKDKPFQIKVKDRADGGRTVMNHLDYAAVRMDREDFSLEVFPVGMLSGTPAERYQDAKEMAADGLISRDAVLDLLDIPDVQRALRYETAPRRAIMKILSGILKSKTPQKAYVYPEPAFNLQLCRALGLLTYLDAFTNEAPEANLRMVLQFALDAEQQIEAEEADAAMQAGAPAGDMQAGADQQLYASPDQPVLPEGAAAPEAAPMMPQV